MTNKDLELLEQRRNKDRNNQLRAYDRAYRILRLRDYLQAPIGLFRKQCPECRCRLEKTVFHDGYSSTVYFKCPQCEYEYARPGI